MNDQTNESKSSIRPVALIAGALGVVQGLVWVVLSLISILIYEEVVKFEPKTGINELIYDYYLTNTYEEYEKEINLLVTSKNFNIFMYLYLILSSALLSISSVVLWAFLRNKIEHFRAQILVLWAATVAIVSALDFVLMALIAHDYHKLKQPEDEEAFPELLIVAIGIVMTVAARGYVIWIINVTLTVVLLKYGYRILKKNRPVRPDPSIIDAYSTSPRPPWDLQNSLYDEANANNFEFNNKGYTNDEPIYTKSESFHKLNFDNSKNRKKETPKPYNPNNNYTNSLDNNQFSFGSANDQFQRQWKAPQIRTAKIGRQNDPNRNSPFNVAPPFIPDPDYSPPGSPKVRSVLRPKSHYAY